MIPSLDSIRAAQRRIDGFVHTTPVFSSTIIAKQAGVAGCFLKCESLQKTGSFKVRGALNAVSQLDAAARARGVVTVSAGNHAQALAWASRTVGVASTVVMPATASESKAAASAGYGAEVIRHGTGAEAFAKAHEIAESRGCTLVHPFEDVAVLTGAATVGMEIAMQVPDADIVLVPVGGGGLLAGVAAAVRQINPKIRVFGVEPTGSDCMRRSFDAGRAVRLETPPKTIADGLAAPFAGERCYAIAKELVEDIILVTDDEIAAAMSLILTRAKLLAEPAGAATTAALLSGRIPRAEGARVVSILSGGNVDLDKLKTLI